MALYKSNKYKGLYEVEQMEEILKIMKIHGTGPKGNFEPTPNSNQQYQPNLITTYPKLNPNLTLTYPQFHANLIPAYP